MSQETEVPRKVELTAPASADLAMLPEIINTQFQELVSLKKHVRRAGRYAAAAKDAADQAQRFKSNWLIFRDKTDAIRRLQGAVDELADAQVSAANAQRISFDYQERIGQITAYLFALGAANLKANHMVVRELERCLQNDGDDELSELARRELKNVISQLKTQGNFSAQLNAQKEVLDRQAGTVEELQKLLTETEERNTALDKKIRSLEEYVWRLQKKQEEQELRSAKMKRIGMAVAGASCIAFILAIAALL